MFIGNIEVFGIVYKIQNMINNKVYIGVTTQEGGFNSRYRYSGSGIERVLGDKQGRKKCYNGATNIHLLNSINKYGIDSFDVVEILDVAFSNLREKLDVALANAELVSKEVKISYDNENVYIDCDLYCVESIGEKTIFQIK